MTASTFSLRVEGPPVEGEGEMMEDESYTMAEVPSRHLSVIDPVPTRAPAGSAERFDGSSMEKYRETWWDDYESDAWRNRRVGLLIGQEPELTLTLLSYLSRDVPVPMGDLVEMGPSQKIFETVFSLYDLGMLTRQGASLSTSDQGREVLERMAIPGA